jgi:hypothetical protein
MAMHTFLDLDLELRRGLGVGLDPLDSTLSSVSSAGVSSVLVVVIIVPDKLTHWTIFSFCRDYMTA